MKNNAWTQKVSHLRLPGICADSLQSSMVISGIDPHGREQLDRLVCCRPAIGTGEGDDLSRFNPVLKADRKLPVVLCDILFSRFHTAFVHSLSGNFVHLPLRIDPQTDHL